MKCLNCQTKTTNPKYCSRSCAAKRNGKLYPKRVQGGTCSYCSKPCRKWSKFCSEQCRSDAKAIYEANLTIEKVTYTKHHRSSAFALIRTRARKIAIECGMTACHICGYDRHVEIAHIVPIASFPSSTPVSEVNNQNNLVALCRNCHWEFDNNIIDLDGNHLT